MLKVGLTGGIASGKTTVLEMFAQLGAHTQRADAVAHQLMEPGEPVYERIVDAFGSGILAEDGTIARPRLAAVAFPHRIAELNAIVHPAVLRWEDEWMERMAQADPQGVCICEAALLIEAGGRARFDRLIVVTCTPEQRVKRYARRLNISEAAARAEVTRRMAAQLPDEEKIKAADFVIDNSGSLESTEQQVQQVFQSLRG